MVRISGEKVGDYYQVETVDITDYDKMPVFGTIIEKLTSTSARVQWLGNVEGVFTGLQPRKMMFVGYDGKPTHIPPTKTVDHWLQVVGYSMDGSTLHISPDKSLVKRIVP